MTRPERVLDQSGPRRTTPLFAWDAARWATIAISLRDLQWLQLRPESRYWNPGKVHVNTSKIDVRLRGRPPLLADAASPSEVYSALMELGWTPPGFIAFDDSAVDTMWSRTDQLLYMSVPRWIMRDEERIYAAEAKAQEEHVERQHAVQKLISKVNTPKWLPVP